MNIETNVILAPFTTFGIGGPADYFVVAQTQEEIIDAISWAITPDVKRPSTSGVGAIPFFILGTGANILIGDKGYRGLVIKNESSQFTVHGSQLTAGSGATIEELIHFTKEKGLSGFEHFAGIPSSVGGALWQNLHFLSPDRSTTVFIGDLVESAEILQTPGRWQAESHDSFQVKSVDRDYFQFSYDYSILHDNHDVVLSATFRLTSEDPKVIQERIDANIKWRQEKHPSNATKSSAGSIFKKIEGHGAGRLIEQVGLKGKQIGGAKISEKHANFIINENHATAKDVRDLIDLVQTTVKQALGLDMQTEISFVGEF